MKGKWRKGKCNRCGGHAPFWAMASTYYESDFCPHCGADMREKEMDAIPVDWIIKQIQEQNLDSVVLSRMLRLWRSENGQ